MDQVLTIVLLARVINSSIKENVLFVIQVVLRVLDLQRHNVYHANLISNSSIQVNVFNVTLLAKLVLDHHLFNVLHVDHQNS